MARNNLYPISGQNPDKLVFFRDAVLDVYQAPNNLYGWSYYKERGYWAVFNAKPIYISPGAALRDARKYCIESEVKMDTEGIKLVVDFCGDSILCQSRAAKRLLGKVEGYRALELYPNQYDRAAVRHALRNEGKASVRCVLQSLDGTTTAGILFAELVWLATNTALSVDTFKPDGVLRFL